MVNNNFIRFAIASICLFTALILPAQAQSDQQTSYYIEETPTGVVFHQRLVWQAEKYALRYEMTIEHKHTTDEDLQKINDSLAGIKTSPTNQMADSGNEWETVLTYATTSTVLELTLPAGVYRYRIIVYNLLERVAGDSGWIPLEIQKALQPEIGTVIPDTVFLEDELPTSFTLSGKYILVDTKFIFFGPKGNQLSIEQPVISSDNTSVTFTVDPTLINLGTYTLKATNPGGLSTSAVFTVKFEKPVDTEVQAGYRPSFVLYDGTFTTYFGTAVYAKTFDLKCTFIPIKRKIGFFGLSLHPQLFFVSRDTDGFSLSTRMWFCSMDFVYQRPLIRRKLFLDVHAGPAVLFIDDLTFTYSNDITTDPFYSWYLGIDAGAGVQYYFTKRIFVEASIEAGTAFLPKMSLYTISPGVRFGYQF